MTRHADLYGLHALPALVTQHGETIAYTAGNEEAVSIKAVVEREPLLQPGGDRRSRVEYPLVIQIAQADVPTVSVGGDTVSLAIRVGDTTTAVRTVAKIIGQTGGMWRLGLT